MIRTTSKSAQGHWRAGVYHGPRGSDWPDDHFTDEQLAVLAGDPRLTVEELDGEPTGQPPARALPDAGQGTAELAERDRQVTEREQALQDQARQLDERKEELAGREKAIAELRESDAFRAIALRYGVQRVVEGQAEADLLKDGKPRTEAISREALGIECSAKERDALFAELYPPK